MRRIIREHCDAVNLGVAPRINWLQSSIRGVSYHCGHEKQSVSIKVLASNEEKARVYLLHISRW